MIYFDHAASSWPKPPEVVQAMQEAVELYGANPGRAGHQLAAQASAKIYATRQLIAKLFKIKDPRQVIFFQNATGALNQAIKGWDWQTGDHLLTTTFEHNSVRRPLEYLRKKFGVTIDYLEPDHNGYLAEELVERYIKPQTKMMIATHVSNVTGAILSIELLGKIAKRHALPFLVDASQSAGMIPIDVERLGIQLLALPGHKGLLGPQGTGVLYIDPQITLEPLWHGGTGSQSEDVDQPLQSPERYEAGTLNTPGIAGLYAGVSFLLEKGIEQVYAHEQELTSYAKEKLSKLPGITLFGPDRDVEQGAVIALQMEGVESQILSTILDQHYQIATRAGLHCSPAIHQHLGTLGQGLLRISFGINNSKQEIDTLIQALEEIYRGFSQ